MLAMLSRTPLTSKVLAESLVTPKLPEKLLLTTKPGFRPGQSKKSTIVLWTLDISASFDVSQTLPFRPFRPYDLMVSGWTPSTLLVLTFLPSPPSSVSLEG